MDEPGSQTAKIEADKPRSVADAVERLFAGATEALNRAANCNDAGWHKFRLGTAAAYQQWRSRWSRL